MISSKEKDNKSYDGKQSMMKFVADLLGIHIFWDESAA